jgi:hypothetical protein
VSLSLSLCLARESLSPLPLIPHKMATCWKCEEPIQQSDPSTVLLGRLQLSNRKLIPAEGILFHDKCLPPPESTSLIEIPPLSPSEVPLPPGTPPPPSLFPIEHGHTSPFFIRYAEGGG